MNAGPATERIYSALLARIQQGGLPPGSRLDPTVLARELGTSVTPVRDALHLLAGQEIIVTEPSRGFATVLLNEAMLVDLYEWTAQILALAIANPQSGSPVAPPAETHADMASRTASLFQDITNHARNYEHRRAMLRANARLHAARLIERRLLPDLETELADIDAAFHAIDKSRLRRLVGQYSRRRRHVSGDIIRTIYRTDQ